MKTRIMIHDGERILQCLKGTTCAEKPMQMHCSVDETEEIFPVYSSLY